MAHFSRFRRRREEPPTATPTTNAESETSSSLSVPSGDSPSSSTRRGRKLSPLRVFHRVSGKRAADRISSSSPTTPSTPKQGAKPLRLSGSPSPAPSKKVSAQGEPRMPAFLDLNASEIQRRFNQLQVNETNRHDSARQHPDPAFRWARVSPSYPKVLDRYMNIQPWNNNRIRLQVPAGHTEYINASPIVLESQSHAGGNPRIGQQGENNGTLGANDQPYRYIAMQGPKQQTTDHAWRMAVEQLESPGVIVMLTEVEEAGQEKCWLYYPETPEHPALEINEHDEFGDGFRASVRCESLETVADGAIEVRKIVVRIHSFASAASQHMARPAERCNGDDDQVMTADSISGTTGSTEDSTALETHVDSLDPTYGNDGQTDKSTMGEERILWHLLYKKWPDFGVPSLDDLDAFFTLMEISHEKNSAPQNPRIVHCSAGVGRSGTFIALDHLMRQLDAGVLGHYDEIKSDGHGHKSDTGVGISAVPANYSEDQDLIFATVNRLREQRCTMVQAPGQYRFIYQVMRQLWHDKYGREEAGEPAAKRVEFDPFVEG